MKKLEVVLRWDVGTIVPAGILVCGGGCGILVLAKSGLEHNRVGDVRRSGEESSDNDVPEHGEDLFMKNSLEKRYAINDRLGRCRETKWGAPG